MPGIPTMRMSGKLLNLGRELARDLRKGRYSWTKGLPDELSEELKKKNIEVKDWEDSPDGALAGLVILLSGWIANQSAAKTGFDPNDAALSWFEKAVRPTIMAAMECGKQYAAKQ